MGWFPAREKNGTVKDENLFFPSGRKDAFPTPFARIRRGSRTYCSDNNNSAKSKTPGKLLVAQARNFGWLNGKKLPKVGMTR